MDVGRQKSYAELVAMVKPQDNGTPEGIRAHNDVSDQIIDELGSKIVHMHVRDIEPDIWAEHKPLEDGFVDQAGRACPRAGRGRNVLCMPLPNVRADRPGRDANTPGNHDLGHQGNSLRAWHGET